MSKKLFSLNKLTATFYNIYNSTACPEIENKQDRPYMVMVIKVEENTFALPLRTNIRHSYCYKFLTSDRETESNTGIDFTKAVIVNNPAYIGDAVTINNKEFVEISKKYHFIRKRFCKYLEGYVDLVRNGGDAYAKKRYRFCTLKYFHKELGL